MASSVLDTLKKIAKNNGINLTDSQLDTELKFLGVDSIQAFTLVIELEKELGVKIPDEKFQNITTVRSIVKIVEELKK
jgi:acyl carrier protein